MEGSTKKILEEKEVADGFAAKFRQRHARRRCIKSLELLDGRLSSWLWRRCFILIVVPSQPSQNWRLFSCISSEENLVKSRGCKRGWFLPIHRICHRSWERSCTMTVSSPSARSSTLMFFHGGKDHIDLKNSESLNRGLRMMWHPYPWRSSVFFVMRPERKHNDYMVNAHHVRFTSCPSQLNGHECYQTSRLRGQIYCLSRVTTDDDCMSTPTSPLPWVYRSNMERSTHNDPAINSETPLGIAIMPL